MPEIPTQVTVLYALSLPFRYPLCINRFFVYVSAYVLLFKKMQSLLTFGFSLCIFPFYTRFLTDSRLTRDADSTTDSGIPVPPLWVWCSISWMLRRPISYMG